MPRFKPVPSLLHLSRNLVASMVHQTAVYLDSISWPQATPSFSDSVVRPFDILGSPGSGGLHLSPLSQHTAFMLGLDGLDFTPDMPLPLFSQNYLDLCKQMQTWFKELPVHLLELVISKVISLIEKNVFHDKDHKLILTIINIDKCKPSDFSFGLHSLLTALANTAITQLAFSTKLWCTISEFDEIGSSRFMKRTLIESLPHFTHLVKVNLSYVATDKFLFLLSSHCGQLEELTLDHSLVSDRGIQFLSGPSSGVRRALFAEDKARPAGVSGSSAESSTASTSSYSLQLDNMQGPFPRVAGCPKLRFLSLDCCVKVTDQALWYLLQHSPRIQVLIYHHQSYSVAEILCQEFSKSDQEISQFRVPRLGLTVMDHPFPYGLNVSDDVIKRVADHCPNIHTFNLVVTDSGLPPFTRISQLRRATIEMEDCFGVGLYKFLDGPTGANLVELTLSCSSDPDATVIPGGGLAHQLFNVGIKLARNFCPNLAKLSLFGCGLVSNQLINLLENSRPSGPVGLKRLRSLILLTYYEDDNPVQTCEEKLLLTLLKECTQLECLSLEGNFSSFMTDNFLGSLFNANKMDKLKILDIRGTKVLLTIASVKRCMNLESIQELRVSAWSVTDAEFNEAVAEIKAKGWDLSLTRRTKTQQQPIALLNPVL